MRSVSGTKTCGYATFDNEAGTTLASPSRGPKDGVHLIGLRPVQSYELDAAFFDEFKV